MIGEVLDGRYEIVSFIGQGGMSLVYKAMHRQLQRPVAIKFLKPEFMGEIANVQRFKREAQAASALQHANVNAVYAVGVTPGGQPYLVLEYLAGKSLSVVLANEKPLAIERAAHIFTQVLDGLAQAHSRGIVHRDLKPSNIVLTVEPDGQEVVKVVDFGLAKLMPQFEGQQQQLTQAGEVLGTLLYMSPEQKRGKTVDARSDLYAVAYMLFEAVSADGIVPQQLHEFIEKGLEEDPAQRFQTAAEMRDALQASLATNGTAGGYTSMPPRNKRPVRIALASGVVLLVVATACAVAWNTPEARRTITYNWLRLRNAPKDEIAKFCLDWAESVQTDKKQPLVAAVILQQDVRPLLPALSPLMQCKALYAIGHNYILQGRVDKASRTEAEMADFVYRMKHDTPYTNPLELQYERWKLTREIDLIPPMNRKKIAELRKIAIAFADHGFLNDADQTWTETHTAVGSEPDLRSLEPAILSEWAASCALHTRSNEMLQQIGERWYQSLQDQHIPIDASNYAAAGLHATKLAQQGDFRHADQVMIDTLPVIPPDAPALVTYLLFESDVSRMRNGFDRALDYAHKALDKTATVDVSADVLARANGTVGDLLEKEDRFDEALPYMKKALSIGGDNVLNGSSMPGFAASYVRCLDSIHAIEGEKFIVDRTLALASTQPKEKWRDRSLSMMARELAAEYGRRGKWEKSEKYAKLSVQFADSDQELRQANEWLTSAYSRASAEKKKE